MKRIRICSGDTDRKDCRIASFVLLVVIWLMLGFELWGAIVGQPVFWTPFQQPVVLFSAIAFILIPIELLRKLLGKR
jgi:hypothetical protein